jgi:hypothetical protein
VKTIKVQIGSPKRERKSEEGGQAGNKENSLRMLL